MAHRSAARAAARDDDARRTARGGARDSRARAPIVPRPALDGRTRADLLAPLLVLNPEPATIMIVAGSGLSRPCDRETAASLSSGTGDALRPPPLYSAFTREQGGRGKFPCSGVSRHGPVQSTRQSASRGEHAAHPGIPEVRATEAARAAA